MRPVEEYLAAGRLTLADIEGRGTIFWDVPAPAGSFVAFVEAFAAGKSDAAIEALGAEYTAAFPAIQALAGLLVPIRVLYKAIGQSDPLWPMYRFSCVEDSGASLRYAMHLVADVRPCRPHVVATTSLLRATRASGAAQCRRGDAGAHRARRNLADHAAAPAALRDGARRVAGRPRTGGTRRPSRRSGGRLRGGVDDPFVDGKARMDADRSAYCQELRADRLCGRDGEGPPPQSLFRAPASPSSTFAVWACPDARSRSEQACEKRTLVCSVRTDCLCTNVVDITENSFERICGLPVNEAPIMTEDRGRSCQERGAKG